MRSQEERDLDMIEDIFDSLSTDDNGKLVMPVCKGLFSKLLEIPLDAIPDDDEELVAFLQLDREARGTSLIAPCCFVLD